MDALRIVWGGGYVAMVVELRRRVDARFISPAPRHGQRPHQRVAHLVRGRPVRTGIEAALANKKLQPLQRYPVSYVPPRSRRRAGTVGAHVRRGSVPALPRQHPLAQPGQANTHFCPICKAALPPNELRESHPTEPAVRLALTASSLYTVHCE